MPVVVGVRFREAGKIYHFASGNMRLKRLDKVVVETAGGVAIGRVVTEPADRDASELAQPVRRVLRRATAEDLRREKEAKAFGEELVERCRRLARELSVPMKPVEADVALDKSRATISYTAEEKVDCRPVAQALAGAVRCRVEFRQIGARDEAKALDGFGPCGQRLCCARWLTEFQPVSIKMAKVQNLVLNPGKLAGVCGRLKCCLRYELDAYLEGERELPPLGATVFTVDGEGRVVARNLLEKKVAVLLDDPTPRWYDAAEVFGHNGCQAAAPERGKGCAGGCRTKP
jgi:cell fate regulator YaaT (PSP1 superfamily)